MPYYDLGAALHGRDGFTPPTPNRNRDRAAEERRLIAQDRAAHLYAMYHLSPAAVSLHTRRWAAVFLFVLLDCLALYIACVQRERQDLASLTLACTYGLCVLLAVCDWQNVRTLHGHLHWSLVRLRRGPLITELLFAVCCAFPLPGICAYLVQCALLAPEVRRIEEEKLDALIAELTDGPDSTDRPDGPESAGSPEEETDAPAPHRFNPFDPSTYPPLTEEDRAG